MSENVVPNVLPTDEAHGTFEGRETHLGVCGCPGKHPMVYFTERGSEPEEESYCLIQSFQVQYGISEALARVLSKQDSEMLATDMLKEIAALGKEREQIIELLELAILGEDKFIQMMIDDLLASFGVSAFDLGSAFDILRRS